MGELSKLHLKLVHAEQESLRKGDFKSANAYQHAFNALTESKKRLKGK